MFSFCPLFEIDEIIFDVKYFVERLGFCPLFEIAAANPQRTSAIVVIRFCPLFEIVCMSDYPRVFIEPEVSVLYLRLSEEKVIVIYARIPVSVLYLRLFRQRRD